MKFLRVLFGLMLLLAIAGGGGYLIYVGSDQTAWSRMLVQLDSYRIFGIGCGIALILLAMLFILTGVRRQEREQFLTFDNEKGAVSISMKAIRDFLAGVGDEFAAILSLQPSLRASSNGLEVELDVRVRAGTQIPELCRMLQDRVKENIMSNLGISDIRGIRVSVHEIVTTPVAAAPKQEERPDWESTSKS